MSWIDKCDFVTQTCVCVLAYASACVRKCVEIGNIFMNGNSV